MNTAAIVILVGLMIFLAHALEDLFAKTKVPDVLLLLGLGILLGPVSHLVRPEHLGSIGPIFTTLTLIIILFEGGLGLELGVLGRSLRGATGLSFWNFLATLAVAAPFGHFFLNLPWMGALTLGASLGGTSSAVVIPLVKRLALGDRIRTILALESALSDVLVIVVALGLMHAQALGQLNVGSLIGGMVASFLLATILGAVSGIAWSMALNRIHGLQSSIFTTPAFVFVVYGLVELMGYSGGIAALALGITLGNIDSLPLHYLRRTPETLASLNLMERQVFAELVFLLKTFFFVYIGISLRLSNGWLFLGGVCMTLALFAARVLVVHLSLSPSDASRFEAASCGAMAPRGLAAAVVASIPSQLGLPGGESIQLTVYAVVFFSILATSLMVFFQERGWMERINPLLYRRFPSASDHPKPDILR